MITPGAAENGLFDWLVAVVCIGVGLWLGRYLPDYWRSGPIYQRTKQEFEAQFGRIQGDAGLASVPVFSVTFAVAGLLVLDSLIYDVSTGLLQSAMLTASYVLLPAVVIVLVLCLTVLFFGRPKLIIPPDLRRQGGIIPELLRWLNRRLFARKGPRASERGAAPPSSDIGRR